MRPRRSRVVTVPEGLRLTEMAAVIVDRIVRAHLATMARLNVSYDLLTTIFQPSTPLHDGAVIVQEDRIAAAACFLPLTVNPRLGKELGSRHRAAIGLTEENDAVAIVVSEETGYISLVADGAIERPLTVDDLRKRLRMMMIRRGRIGSLLTAEPAQ